jgi:hypothetical protein
MTVPEDADRVLSAIKLGWSIAEVRGRNRPDAPPGARARLPGPPGHALPLHVEQTRTELRIGAQAVLAAVARALGVDDRGANRGSYTEEIDTQAQALAQARAGGVAARVAAAPDGAAAPAGAAGPGAAADGEAAPGAAAVPGAVAAVPGAAAAVASAAPGDPDAQWDALQELIFKFDEHIQDALAMQSDTVANGYQLGRALAEPYWALDPALDTDQSPAAWAFLLGSGRCAEISRVAGRLGVYFHPYTAAAVAGSVQIWKHVAADKTWRSTAEDYLYRQTRTWYELMVMRQDPTTLLQPYALTRSYRMIVRALRIFWPEVLGVVVAAGALSGFVVLLGENKVKPLLNSALGLIAIAGFTTAGFLAKLKNQAQAMVTRLRQDVYTDLVAVAITIVPDMPSVPQTHLPLLPSKRTRQNARLVKMTRERRITPVTPN